MDDGQQVFVSHDPDGDVLTTHYPDGRTDRMTFFTGGPSANAIYASLSRYLFDNDDDLEVLVEDNNRDFDNLPTLEL